MFCFFDQLSPSDDTLDPSFPEHHRAPTRPSPLLATSVFTKPPRRFHQTPPTPSRFSPAHGGATRCGFHPRYPLRLRTTPPPCRRPPRLPLPIVSFSGCPFLLLKSHIAGPPLPPPSLHLLPLNVPTFPRVRGPPLSNVSVATLSPLSTIAILRCTVSLAMTSAGWFADTTSRLIASLPTPTTSATSPTTWPVSPPLRPSTPFFKHQQNFVTRCPRSDPSLSSGIPAPAYQ